MAAAPAVRVAAGVGDAAAVEAQVASHWIVLEQLFVDVTGRAAAAGRGDLRVVAAEGLDPAQAAVSHPGRIALRPLVGPQARARRELALRHEVAHQFLWSSCPAAAGDRLFHEAFALATSGELAAWTAEGYLSLPEARRRLEEARGLDGPAARQALARIVGNGPLRRGLPEAVAQGLGRCAEDQRWQPLTLDTLIAASYGDVADATVVLSRHSGELLRSEGASGLVMPYGSVLKPFVVAGAASTPRLSPRRERPEWQCGEDLADPVDAATALLRSCNGYFLDWARDVAEVARLGTWGPLLLELGLPRLPADASEAIGIKPTLGLSPLAVAQAYRVLAVARPDLIEVLRHNAAEGTLAELPASAALTGVALKTGTVRDDASRPRLGWIAAVDEDVVVVLVRRERAPRQFAEQLVATLRGLRGRRELLAAQVQVLGLIPPEHIEVRCEGLAVGAHRSGPVLLDRRFAPLLAAVDGAPALCLGAPWDVRFPDIAPDHRAYAGQLELSQPPRYRPPPGVHLSRRQVLARQGSDFVLTTTLGRYTAGVLRAEDARVAGAAREALARVIAHNAQDRSRHPGRPPCDTTHCQVLQGTPAWTDRPRGLDPVPWTGWLPFARGGDEPWSRPLASDALDALLGAGWRELRRDGEQLRYLRQVQQGALRYEEAASIPCEVVRGRLRLPACPDAVVRDAAGLVARGRGEGHGLGLDVEAAKRSALDADAILREAYGPPAVPGAQPFSPASPRGKK